MGFQKHQEQKNLLPQQNICLSQKKFFVGYYKAQLATSRTKNVIYIFIPTKQKKNIVAIVDNTHLQADIFISKE